MHAIRRRRREEEHVRAVERFDGRASGRRRRADTLVGPYARPPLHRRADNVPPLLSVPPIPPLLLIRVISRTRTRTLRHARRDLPERCDVIHDPERPPHRRREQIAMVHLEIGDGRRGQVLLQRLPVLPLIERHVRALERAGVQQSFLLGIFAHDVHWLIGRDAVRAVGEQRPVLAVIVGHIEVRLEVVEVHPVHGHVRRSLAVRRILDGVHASAGRQPCRRDVLPMRAAVLRHPHRAVVRTGPEHRGLEPRRAHRVQRRVHFLAGHVARDRLARRHLTFGAVRRHIRAEARPVDAAVGRLVHVLRPVIDDFRIVRIDLDRRLPHEPVLHVLRIFPVALLRINPVMLLLPGLDVVAAELTLAVAVDDLPVRHDANLAALAT